MTNHDEPPHLFLLCYECKTLIDGDDDGGRMVNGVYLCEECVVGCPE